MNWFWLKWFPRNLQRVSCDRINLKLRSQTRCHTRDSFGRSWRENIACSDFIRLRVISNIAFVSDCIRLRITFPLSEILIVYYKTVLSNSDISQECISRYCARAQNFFGLCKFGVSLLAEIRALAGVREFKIAVPTRHFWSYGSTYIPVCACRRIFMRFQRSPTTA